MSIWSIVAAPLIMSSDLRTVSDEYRAILLNKEVIAVDQDPLAIAGTRVTPKGDGEVWARPLIGGAVAVVLYNRLSPFGDEDCTWNVTVDKYLDADASGNIDCTSWDSLKTMRTQCCGNSNCAGFSITNGATGGDNFGCLKNSAILSEDASWTVNSQYDGWLKLSQETQKSDNLTIRFNFDQVNFMSQEASVRDLWAGEDLGTFQDSFSASVPPQGVVMVKLTAI